MPDQPFLTLHISCIPLLYLIPFRLSFYSACRHPFNKVTLEEQEHDENR